jgi:DNA-binding response OmpR family regulator
MDAGPIVVVVPEVVGSPEVGEREAALLDALRSSGRRVVTRRELARAAGLREHPRRVDVHLVNVRRMLSSEELINVRGRGWMLVPAASTAS